MIELIVAMILIGILAVSLWPRIPSAESMTINSRAEQLASDIRYVQTRSMTSGQRFCLTLTASSYSLNTTDAGNVCTAITDEHPGRLTQPIAICNSCMSWTNLPSNLVQFDGLGVPYTSASATLVADAVITLTDEGTTRTVRVSPATGRVIVQ